MAERLKNWLLPLLFGSSVAYMIIKCYHNADAFVLSCVFFAYALFCFILFDLIRKTKIFAPVLYILLFVAVMTIGVRIISEGYRNGSFNMHLDKWFYGAQTEATKVFEYSFVLIFCGGFFIISILYYFTQVIYRVFGTLLIMLFPLFIYAKRLETINVFHFGIVLTFYIAVLVHNRQMKCDKNSVVITNKSYFACVGVFVTVVSLVTLVLPQPDILAVQEKDDTFFSNLVDTTAPQDFSDTSSLSGGRLSDEILFYVETDKPVYLRRQSFDNYSYDYGWSMNDDDPMFNKIPKQNDDYVNNTTFVSMIQMLDKAEELVSDDMYFDYPTVNFDFPQNIYGKVVNEDTFRPWYIQLPLYTTNTIDSNYNKLLHGEYKPVQGVADYVKNNSFKFNYLPVNSIPGEFVSQFNYSYSDILSVLEHLKNVTADLKELEIIEDLYTEVEYTSSRFDDLPELSPELYELAMDITSGLNSPYEKAKALEGYFEEENFEYNVDVYPDDVDDFVFNKKKGACGQFATAMTLMARAAGLTARYVEGFVVEEKSENSNSYVVREYHSHAYVEVYINGLGWMVFEPTVSGFLDFYHQKDALDVFDVLKKYGFFIAFASLIAFIIYISRNIIAECVFVFLINFFTPKKSIILCYNRLVKFLSRYLMTDLSSKTSDEIRLILKNMSLNGDILISIFEKTCYGYKEISGKEKNTVYDEYKALKRSIRKMKINY
ncbi:MAG: transglutaminase domain-containing protein [Ruminococcus sp.]|nr:transglutaminase domain-containing protein [Ruminococcus sp.]